MLLFSSIASLDSFFLNWTLILSINTLIEKISTDLPSLTAEFFYNSGVVKNYKSDFIGAKNDFEYAQNLAVKESEVDLQAKILPWISNLSIDILQQTKIVIYLLIRKNQ